MLLHTGVHDAIDTLFITVLCTFITLSHILAFNDPINTFKANKWLLSKCRVIDRPFFVALNFGETPKFSNDINLSQYSIINYQKIKKDEKSKVRSLFYLAHTRKRRQAVTMQLANFVNRRRL